MTHSRTESARMAGPAFAPVRLVETSGCRPLPAGLVLDALGKIRDLVAGAGLLVQMIERDEIERDTEDGMRLFSNTDRGTLIRLAASAACAAADMADDLQEWATDHHDAALWRCLPLPKGSQHEPHQEDHREGGTACPAD